MRLIDADALIMSLDKRHEHWKEIVSSENKDIEFAHQYAVNVIRNAPTAEPTGDLISREDAIKAVAVAVLDDRDELEAIKAIPSAKGGDADITVIPEGTGLMKPCPDNGADLISREDAMQVVFKSPFFSESLIEELKALPSAEPSIKAIKRQIDEHWYLDPPSADAVQGWIPVEEQPPQFPCLVCDANGNQPSVPLGIVTITDEEHGEWHIDGRLWDSPKVFVDGEWGSQLGYGNRIIAWMPLPTPYKGGDDK